jgi:hypothetical protein
MPGFIAKLFGSTIEKRIEKAKKKMLKYIKKYESWESLCHTLQNS